MLILDTTTVTYLPPRQSTPHGRTAASPESSGSESDDDIAKNPQKPKKTIKKSGPRKTTSCTFPNGPGRAQKAVMSSAASALPTDVSALLGDARANAPGAQLRAAELFAGVEGALGGLPDGGARAGALNALRELRDAAAHWAGCAQRLQVGYDQLYGAIRRPSVSLQPAPADAQAAIAAADSELAENGDRSFGPAMCNMLIVEDSSFQAMTMLALAEESGYTAQVVASADEALQVLEHNEDINLVLTDVMMDGAGPPRPLHPASHTPSPHASAARRCRSSFYAMAAPRN